MKLLMVGPGNMKIPNDGWGAIEIVIWQLKLHLEALGHKVDILNKRGRKAALKARPWKYDFVHLHSDKHAHLWVELQKQYRFQLIATTHHSYAAFPKYWRAADQQTHRSLLQINHQAVLSREIKKVFLRAGYAGKLAVLPNGAEISKIQFSGRSGNGKAVCLGKISSRKQQAKLAQLIDRVGGLDCDFVGPIADPRFTCNHRNTHYLGQWNRSQVHRLLTGYSCLLLPSRGEAHALVVMEALAAGLSVVVTSEASANLDRSLPFVHVEKLSEEYIRTAARACRDNAKYRRQIRDYAKRNFDWKRTAKQYLRILRKWRNPLGRQASRRK